MKTNAPTFEKEVLHETVVVKDGESYSITPDFLNNCVVQYQRMKKTGMKVNVHSGHNHLPETKRGEVLDLYVKTREDGRAGLFGKIAFLPHLPLEVIQTLISNDVSVELPVELYDGKGNLYHFPVQRVAITPDPAVSGMQPFIQQRDTSMNIPFLTLSIDTLNNKENNMNDDQLNEGLQEEDIETPIEANGDGMDEDVAEPVVTNSKDAFVDSQLAKIIFDAFGVDPDDYDNQEDLMTEVTARFNDFITLQRCLFQTFGIDENDPNKHLILINKLTQNDDEDDDVDGLEDNNMPNTQTNYDADTIDGSINKIEQDNKTLQLSLNNLQKKYQESADVIQQLVAQNRQLKLDSMLQSGILTKPAHQKAVQKFVLKLSLNDSFDDFVEVANVNIRANVGNSKTPPQQPGKKRDTSESWTNVGKRIASQYKRQSD